MKIVLFFIVSITRFALAFTNSSELIGTPPALCYIPKYSQWNWDTKKLVFGTKEIVIAELTAAKHSGKRPTVVPDFPAEGGIAFQGRDRKTGKRFTQLDDVWGTNKWSFKVVETLKGNLKSGSSFDLITLLKREKMPSKPFSPLCDLPIAFELNKKYLIFKDSFNPSGYLSIKGENDEWLLSVRRYLSDK